MNLRIGLDIDDTICDFMNPYLERFGTPTKDLEITKNVSKILIKDKDFWINLPIIHYPNFTPVLYCTKRVHPKSWSKKYLELNNLPNSPIYQIYCQSSSKATRIKGRVDLFIDDSVSNFIDLNLHGIPCLLMDASYNKSWGPVARVYSLDIKEIEDCYNLFLNTIFPNFKEFIKWKN